MCRTGLFVIFIRRFENENLNAFANANLIVRCFEFFFFLSVTYLARNSLLDPTT